MFILELVKKWTLLSVNCYGNDINLLWKHIFTLGNKKASNLLKLLAFV